MFRLEQFSWEEFDGVEYLTREFTYTDKFGEEHCYQIADETLSKVLWEEELQSDIDNSDIDNKYYCYAPVSILIIEDGQRLAQALEDYGIDMDLIKGEIE